jgi:hypothetical protein
MRMYNDVGQAGKFLTTSRFACYAQDKHAGQVAELEDAYGLGPYGETRVGSNPTLPTLF